jgi:DNA-binding GntR family transcriptional regulator
MAINIYRTIREQIADQLRREVLSGQLKSGDSLREQKLAERFGVSRGPIRDALLQLTQEGLLVSQPNVGVKVGHVPSEAIRSLIIILRRHIEHYALERIFATITPADIRHWEEILERLKAACQRGDMAALVEHDMTFHRSIIERADDADLMAVWLPIVLRMRLIYSRHTDLMQCHAEHERVLEAIRRGDLPGAVAALEANIR